MFRNDYTISRTFFTYIAEIKYSKIYQEDECNVEFSMFRYISLFPLWLTRRWKTIDTYQSISTSKPILFHFD